MNVEIEHDGKRCTKALVDGVPFGKKVLELDIHIEGGEKPKMIIKADVDNLKINGKDIQIFQNKKEERENGKSTSNN